MRIVFRLLPLQAPIVAGSMIQCLSSTDASAIPYYGATLAGLALLTGWSAYGSDQARRRMEQDMEEGLQRQVWMAWQQAAPSFRREYGSDRFASQTLRYSSGLGDLAGGCAMEAVAMACRIVYPVLMLLVLDPLLALLPLSLLPLQWLLSRLAWAHAQRHTAAERDARRRAKRIWRESLEGVETLQAMGAQMQGWQWISDAEQDFAGAKTARRRYERMVSSGLWGLAALGLALSWWAGALRVASGALTLGQLVTFAGFVGFLSLPLRRFGSLTRKGNTALAKLAEVEQFLRDATPVPGQPADITASPGEMRLQGVRFQLNGNPLFHGLDARFPAGEWIWIRGRGGTGKSTLLRLLAGLERPAAGAVEYSGQPMAGPRRDVVLAPQEVTVFEGTLRANLLMGWPDTPEALLRQSCQSAGLGPLLASLPNGLESPLGERGARLSASERRRLAIARALVRQPRVLLLDESTTGLEEQAELDLLENLRSLRPAMTVILVASQLRSLVGINRVIELRDGSLAEWPLGACVETKGTVK